LGEGPVWPPRKEDLERLYLVEGLSAAKIAKVYGLSYKSPKVAESAVLLQLKRCGIKRRGKTDHVRIVSEELVERWIQRYKAGESLKQIAGGDVSPVTVWNRLRQRGFIMRDKVEAQISAVSKYERKPFKGDDLEKAYLLGLRHGDLDVVKHGRAVRVRVSTTHKAMAYLFESLFSQFGHVHRYPRTSRFTGFEWSLECDLDSSFGFLLIRPAMEEIESYSKREFMAFLAGFFDAEGSIFLHRKSGRYVPELTLTNTDVALLTHAKQRLEEQGFHLALEKREQRKGRSGGMPAGVIYRLRAWRFREVQLILGLLRVRHPEKVAEKTLIAGLVQPSRSDSNRLLIAKLLAMREDIIHDRNDFVSEAERALDESDKT